MVVEAGGREIEGLASTYADAPAGAVCALFGSTEHLEVAVNGGSAAAALGLGRGIAGARPAPRVIAFPAYGQLRSHA